MDAIDERLTHKSPHMVDIDNEIMSAGGVGSEEQSLSRTSTKPLPSIPTNGTGTRSVHSSIRSGRGPVPEEAQGLRK